MRWLAWQRGRGCMRAVTTDAVVCACLTGRSTRRSCCSETGSPRGCRRRQCTPAQACRATTATPDATRPSEARAAGAFPQQLHDRRVVAEQQHSVPLYSSRQACSERCTACTSLKLMRSGSKSASQPPAHVSLCCHRWAGNGTSARRCSSSADAVCCWLKAAQSRCCTAVVGKIPPQPTPPDASVYGASDVGEGKMSTPFNGLSNWKLAHVAKSCNGVPAARPAWRPACQGHPQPGTT